MRRNWSLLLGISLCAGAIASCADTGSGNGSHDEEVSSPSDDEGASSSSSSDKTDPVLGHLTSKVGSKSILAALEKGTVQDVIVELSVAKGKDATHLAISDAVTHARNAVMNSVRAHGIKLGRTYSHLPMMVV